MITSRHFHESNLIEGFNSSGADVLLAEAWDYLRLIPIDSLTHSDIRLVQSLVVMHQDIPADWRGRYREWPGEVVYIGGRRAANPFNVVYQMDAWLDEYRRYTELPVGDKRRFTWDSHIRFERIHPFMDGNGRTGRLLMWRLQATDETGPALITKSNVRPYYDLFDSREPEHIIRELEKISIASL